MHAEVLSSADFFNDEQVLSSPDDSTLGVPSLVTSLAGLAAGRMNSSRRKCLLPESIQRRDGTGPVVALEEYVSKLLVVTLDITNVVERTGLTVSIWGSPDEAEWGTKPLLTLRQRQYCGIYSVLLNMATYPEVRYIRVHWSMNRCGKTERTPLFGFEVFAEESGARISGTSLP